MSDRMFRVKEAFTEEEIACVISACDFYAYNGPHIDEEKFEWIMSAMNKVLSAAEYGEI